MHPLYVDTNSVLRFRIVALIYLERAERVHRIVLQIYLLVVVGLFQLSLNLCVLFKEQHLLTI